ncbi:MAG: class I SAM-dependent methyltransferase [Ilumatobacteraceae bacterium]
MSAAHESDLAFAGSIPDLYETLMVPLIFQPYADDLAIRVAGRGSTDVLEVAAGTGVVTRALSSRLGPDAAITATDLNQPMIDHAAKRGTQNAVTWRQADALELPFGDAEFDTVICQFGAMFFPDRIKAYREFYRVLCPGGALVFNVWDRIEHNEFAAVVTDAVAAFFPDDPPRFLARTPHGYHDTEVSRPDLTGSGFTVAPEIDTIEARSRAASCTVPAIAYCQGSPLRNEIVARDPNRLADATAAAASVVGDRFGQADIDGKIQAHVITVEKT